MLIVLLAFLAAVVGGTLLEYVGHRLMHARLLLSRRHAEHHQDGHGQGVLGEFIDYSVPVLILLWIGFLHSIAAGVSFALGGLAYAALAAYAHQVQHERPELVFWLPRPVHYLHHTHHMWRHNFGILVDFWDRVFGTYKVVEWKPERRPVAHPWQAFFRIRWY
jgi:sterol desaturase/sphingolipid hydroxylase (fatty acid hydroxylase superfamily)